MMKKGNLAALGLEPTPPKKLVPKTSTLDHSATLPDTQGESFVSRLDSITRILSKIFKEKNSLIAITHKSAAGKKQF